MELKRWCLKIVGVFCLALGAVGIVLPVLPTTPFVIVAAVCFSASSPRLAAWLAENRYFGPYIDHYKNKTGVPLRQKVAGIIFLWGMLGISMVVVHKPLVTLILCGVGIAVTLHLVMLKTRS